MRLSFTANHESRISNNFPGFWDIHSDQMRNPNEAQDCYRPGQLFLRQQIPQNTFPPAMAVLAPFQPLQLAQAGYSGTVPLPLASTPPETPEPQEASEAANLGKAGRGYGKWRPFSLFNWHKQAVVALYHCL